MANKSVTLHNDDNDNLYPNTTASLVYMTNGNTVESEITNIKEQNPNKGFYSNPSALYEVYPNNIQDPNTRAGWFVTMGSTDTIWLWDVEGNEWVNSFNKPSDVNSVNGQTGDVVLTGNNINATATVGVDSVTKSVDAHLTDLYSNKLDKVTSTSGDKRLYVINQDGTQTTVRMDYANTATGGHVPLRSSSGALMINDSTYSDSGQFADGLQAINKNKLLERTTALTGSSAPTTSTTGFVGQLYIDTTNNNTYQCVAITTENNTTTYTWTQLIRITDRGGYGTNGVFGVAGVPDTYGINFMDYNGARLLIVQPATTTNITNRDGRAPITPTNLNFAVKSSLTDANHLTMTSNEQAVAQEVIGVNVLTGSGAPTTSTVGNIGQLYLDTSNDYKLYQCVAKTTSNDTTTYTWKEVVGGKIDSISIDDVALVIDASKNVNIPIAENGPDEGGDAGVVKLQGTHYAGIAVNPTTKNMSIAETTDSDTFWNNRKSYGFAVKASNLDKYLKLALGSTSSEADNTTTWTDTNKTNACNKIGASSRGIARL